MATSFKDRTSEFFSIAENARNRMGTGAIKAPSRPNQQKSQFTSVAAEIGRDIHMTSQKLAKLTKLTQKNSIFDDPAADIQELTYVIKQDIQGMNQKIDFLGSLNQKAGGDNVSAHHNNVVNSLKSKLADTTKDFKSALETRTETLKEQNERKNQFSYGTTQGRISANNPMYQRQNSNPDGSQGDVVINIPQQAQAQVMGQETNYLNDRAAAVQNVQSTIAELGTIFNRLATMIEEQREQVERIDANVDDTISNVQRGEQELLKYLNSVSSNRWLIAKVFAVLFVFIVIFGGVIW